MNFMHYNFCRIHQSLRVKPAMEAGVEDHVWEVADIVDLIEAAAPNREPRGPNKKRAAKSDISN